MTLLAVSDFLHFFLLLVCKEIVSTHTTSGFERLRENEMLIKVTEALSTNLQSVRRRHFANPRGHTFQPSHAYSKWISLS